MASVEIEQVRVYFRSRRQVDRYRPERLRSFTEAARISHGVTGILQKWLALELHAYYPFRPKIRLRLTELSRAFFHRPNLRLGIVLNRLLARSPAAHIQAHAHYQEHWVALKNCMAIKATVRLRSVAPLTFFVFQFQMLSVNEVLNAIPKLRFTYE